MYTSTQAIPSGDTRTNLCLRQRGPQLLPQKLERSQSISSKFSRVQELPCDEKPKAHVTTVAPVSEKKRPCRSGSLLKNLRAAKQLQGLEREL